MGAFALDEGGRVVDEFALPVLSANDPFLAVSFWEYVRVYMECGPGELPGIAYCLPLDSAMDTWALAAYSARPPCGGVDFEEHSQPSPLGRWLIKTICRRPEWPPEVENECRCDNGDPFARDASGQELFTSATLAEMDRADQLFYKERLDYVGVKRTLTGLYGGNAFK